MVEVTDFQMQKEMEFNTHGNVGGVNLFRGTIVGFNLGSALPATTNVGLLHRNIYPFLPQPVKDLYAIDAYQDMMFVRIDSNGTITDIALPWIVKASIQVIQKTYAIVHVENLTQADVAGFKEHNRLSGFPISHVEFARK